MDPSDPDEAFASIVARLGDMGKRRSRRVVIAASAAVGTAVVLILALGLRWQWSALVVFIVTFVIALLAGLAAMNRVIHRREK